jgi:hypothetical protein
MYILLTKVQCEAIQAKFLCVDDILLNICFGYTTDHVVRNTVGVCQ